jgi:hypothetical protein
MTIIWIKIAKIICMKWWFNYYDNFMTLKSIGDMWTTWSLHDYDNDDEY